MTGGEALADVWLSDDPMAWTRWDCATALIGEGRALHTGAASVLTAAEGIAAAVRPGQGCAAPLARVASPASCKG